MRDPLATALEVDVKPGEAWNLLGPLCHLDGDYQTTWIYVLGNPLRAVMEVRMRSAAVRQCVIHWVDGREPVSLEITGIVTAYSGPPGGVIDEVSALVESAEKHLAGATGQKSENEGEITG